MNNAYQQMMTYLRETAILGSVGSVLHWDQETQMPPKGAEHRAKQLALLAKMTHEQFTSPKVGAWLTEIESSDVMKDPESDSAVNTREYRRQYDRAVKLPTSLVEALARTQVLAHMAWVEAKKESNFSKFAPWLEKIMELRRQEAACHGGNTYDALLEDYEPGEKSANLKQMFEKLRPPLVDLVGRIASSKKKPPVHLLERPCPIPLQEKIGREAAKAIGYDFEAGRLDISVHPFSTDLGPGDSRITTRYSETDFASSFFGVMHETGHSLYSQGLPADHWGTPRGEYISLGIHESQSRMWENLVGRSRPFWEFFLPKVKQAFAKSFDDVVLDDWYFAINEIRPSLIRTEADEATYNLHVLLRFELEIAMLDKQLSIADLPGAWNEKMNKYFGLTPPDDAHGCLQDTHWSGGALGYFPTYTLGNLYAAQFFDQAKKDLPGLEAGFARGEFAPLLGWLRKNIHQHGKKYPAPELVKRVTGKALTHEALMAHLNRKASELYGV